ncbi:MAG: hypothetical protein MJ066_02170 [Clostridia bacterium]|nr:hypothetical protein [Clostridia bacterium]
MENLLNEQTSNSLSYEAENEKKMDDTGVDGKGEKEVSFGKFKNAEALFSAYNSLQAEFTKRCQRVKELEGEIKTREEQKSTDADTKPQTISITDKEKEDILKDYLKSVLSNKSEAIIMDGKGSGIVTPSARPKTIEEAGTMALELLKKTV